MDQAKRRIWGWYFFDWASQPYATLLLTFIFGPYVAEVLGDGSRAQAAWGYGVGAAGLAIAVFAPILGAIADAGGQRMRWIAAFSVLYVVGAGGLWFADPADFDLVRTLLFFCIGLVGMEFATIFTNSMLPDLGPRDRIGRISGNGWAFGYLGGLAALVLMLVFFAESPETGQTYAGLAPAFGLDPSAREGTRFVGPLTALWYAVFMLPFFLFVRIERPASTGKTWKDGLRDLGRTLEALPRKRSLSAYLASSMLYRDALNGMYTFGGIYAAGVLGWQVADVAVFGILAIVTGALFSWLGGRADSAFGPKPVIVVSICILSVVACLVALVSSETVFGIPVPEGSALPDIAFYGLGATIGAAGGVLQSASRTMMVRQADPARMTEGFGLYALAGKATSFLAPFLIAVVTSATGSQQLGVTPLILLFLLGLGLLWWVEPDGDRAA